MNNLTVSTPAPVNSLDDAALEPLLAGKDALMILLSGTDGPRSDARTEFDKVASEMHEHIQFIRMDTTKNPHAAAYFEVDRHALLITWANGEAIARRHRPWGTDVRGMADELLKIAPVAPVKDVIVKTQRKPIKVTEATFQDDVIDSELPVLVDFWAEWCGPCKKIAPILEKLAVDYAGKLVIAKVNTDENRQMSAYFKIESIPSLMFVKNQKIYDLVAGAYPEANMRTMIDKFLSLS